MLGTVDFMNTNVTRGSGQFVVTATGMNTEVGHISGMLQVDTGQETPLTRQINALTQHVAHAGLASIASSLYPTRNRATGVGCGRYESGS